MITVITFTVIGIILMLIVASKNYYLDWFDYFAYTFFGVVIGVFTGIVIALMLPGDTYDKNDVLKLKSLQDGSGGVSGSFFLGCGQIDGKMKYVFYYEDDGFYKMAQIESAV